MLTATIGAINRLLFRVRNASFRKIINLKRSFLSDHIVSWSKHRAFTCETLAFSNENFDVSKASHFGRREADADNEIVVNYVWHSICTTNSPTLFLKKQIIISKNTDIWKQRLSREQETRNGLQGILGFYDENSDFFFLISSFQYFSIKVEVFVVKVEYS